MLDYLTYTFEFCSVNTIDNECMFHLNNAAMNRIEFTRTAYVKNCL